MPYITTTARIDREEGREEGRQQGKLEGLQQGLLALRESVLETLAIRFGEVERGLRKRILCANDIDNLRRLQRWAVKSASLSEFKKHLQK